MTGYLRFCLRTTRWTYEGRDALAAATKDGPVLFAMWHERSLFGPAHWPDALGELSTLFASSAIGRVGGDMHRRFGRRPMKMSEKRSNAKVSREVLKRLRDGISIGMTTDGPNGPARVVNDATLGWAGAIGRPVFCYAFAVKRHKRLKTWDRMMFPFPFTRGHVVFHTWDGTVPRKADDETLEAARRSLGAALNAACEKADKGV
ncbi:lysophospholipid acyltransferase family protein [Cognatiyoonia koreensis]|uniref:lysophospholipid acyltransferase family protein n=1 Tax=Cognatiyoonia koreensis TaxID=364200 RepID=UPI0013F4CA98|nr:DUF374 domain-containing protein [Cognatiyoonia koreensis]